MTEGITPLVDGVSADMKWLEGVTDGVRAGNKDAQPYKIIATIPVGARSEKPDATFTAGSHAALVEYAQKHFRGASSIRYRLIHQDHLPASHPSVPVGRRNGKKGAWPPRYGSYVDVDVDEFLKHGRLLQIRPMRGSLGSGAARNAPADPYQPSE